MRIFQVSESIWCVRRASYLTCSYIVRTAQGAVLVDAGMDSKGHDMQRGLAAIGLPASAVQAILLTHWHNDHAAGARAIQEKSGAAVCYHQNEEPYLTRETAQSGLRGWLSDQIPELGPLVLFKGLLGEAAPRAVTAQTLVSDGQVILKNFEVIEAPGHTPGHVSYYYHPERALFAGDALAVVGEKVRLMARPVTPDLSRARESVVRCLSREIDILCPGHRQPLTKNTGRLCREMILRLEKDESWPLFG